MTTEETDIIKHLAVPQHMKANSAKTDIYGLLRIVSVVLQIESIIRISFCGEPYPSTDHSHQLYTFCLGFSGSLKLTMMPSNASILEDYTTAI